MMKKMVIPVGFRFSPTEEELINSYLRPKIMGQILPCNIVEEKQLYGASDPWDVLHDGNQWIVLETDKLGNIVKKIIYVFTKLTKKAAGGKTRKNSGAGGKEQFVRAAGCGTWDGQTGPREVENGNGEVIGFRRMLVFEIRTALNPSPNPRSTAESTTANPGHWIMHEYSLPGGESDYVVCEIILDLRKKTKRLRKSDEEASPSNIESQVLPLAVEYPNSSTTNHELMPMTESQEQTLEWDDFINLDELLDSEVTRSGLMPMIESQEQTLESEWDDLVKLDELNDPRFDLIFHEFEEILRHDGGNAAK